MGIEADFKKYAKDYERLVKILKDEVKRLSDKDMVYKKKYLYLLKEMKRVRDLDYSYDKNGKIARLY